MFSPFLPTHKERTLFIEAVIHSINKYESTMDFTKDSNDSTQPISLDERLLPKLLKPLDETNKLVEEDYNALLEIVRQALHIEMHITHMNCPTYYRLLQPKNMVWVGNESILLHIFNNATQLLYQISKFFKYKCFLKEIPDYLIFGREYYSETEIDDDLQNICNFTYVLIRNILFMYRFQESVRRSEVDALIRRLLSTRFYTDVYLLVNGYLYSNACYDLRTDDINQIQAAYSETWDFGLQQAGRASKTSFVSSDDKKSFRYYSENIAERERQIADLQNQITELETKKNTQTVNFTYEEGDLLDELTEKKRKLICSLDYIKLGREVVGKR